MESYWLYVLLALSLITFLFVFFWFTQVTEDAVKKK